MLKTASSNERVTTYKIKSVQSSVSFRILGNYGAYMYKENAMLARKM